ncbi:TlpA family protein disulfide reductase [Kaarinaea lacus]
MRLMVRILFVLALSFILSANASETVDFTLPDLDGKPRQLSEFRGKWVVVNYWATWCPPCLDEIPELVDFHEEHKDKNAVVLGVDFEDIAIPKLKTFVEDYFMSYPILHMKPGPGSELGAITGLPTSFLVSPEGKLVAKQTGPVTAKMIKDFIDGYDE